MVANLDAGLDQGGDPLWCCVPDPLQEFPCVPLVAWGRVVHCVAKEVPYEGISDWGKLALRAWWGVVCQMRGDIRGQVNEKLLGEDGGHLSTGGFDAPVLTLR